MARGTGRPPPVYLTLNKLLTYLLTYMVGREDKRTNNRTMIPALKNNTAAGYKGPVKRELLKCAGLLATRPLVCPELYTTGPRCCKGLSLKQALLNMLMPLDSSRNIGPQRHSSNALGFGSSSSVRPTTFR